MKARTTIIGLVAVTAAIVASGASAFHVADAPPPDGVVGMPYSFVFEPKDGAPPYGFGFGGGELPPGLKIESDGLFHGTPTVPGTFIFDVNASQCCGPDSQRTFTVKIRDKLAITTNALKPGAVGVPYSAVVAVTGNGGLGMGWSVSAGTLPAGLTLAPDGTPGDTMITGTPTTSGTSTFTVKVGDTDGYIPNRAATKQFTIVVVAPLVAQPAAQPPPTGVVGKPYVGVAPGATGGLAPYQWTLTGGNAPPGLSVDPATGALGGTPTAAGTFAYTLGVTDTGGRTASTSATVTIVAALDIVTTRVRDARVGRPYRVKLLAVGGMLPRTWALTRGKLPRGLRLDTATGILSGTARTAGTFRFTVAVSDTLLERSTETLVMSVRA